MKKGFFILILGSVLLLAACGNDEGSNSASDGIEVKTGSENGPADGVEFVVVESAKETEGESENVPSAAGRLDEDYADALPIQSQLALGTLQLEETDLAVDETLASKLLPLWQAYQSLKNSDTAASAELSAVLNQIQDTMTAEQVQAIAGMALTPDEATAYMEENGQAFGRGAFGGGFRGEQEEGNGPGGGGDFAGGPPGGVPGGGGGVPGGRPGEGGFAGGGGFGRLAEQFGELSEEEIADLFTQRVLLNALITSLRVKTGELDEADLQRGLGRAPFDFFGIAAEASGVPVETLQEAMGEGATLAEAITTNGGDIEATKLALEEALSEIEVPEGQDVGQQTNIDDLLNQSFSFPNNRQTE